MTLTLEDRKQIYSTWHSDSWCCITIPNLVKKCSLIQKISSGQTFTDIFYLCCDLDLNPIFPQDTPAYDAVLSNQVWLQRNQHFRRYSRNSHILIISELAVTLTLKTVNQFFCVTLWLMIMHHNTKFGNKMFLSLEDIILTNTDILSLCCDLDLENNKPIFLHDTLAHDAASPYQIW